MNTITQKQIDRVADTAQIIASNFDALDEEKRDLQFTVLLTGLDENFAMACYNAAIKFILDADVVIYAAIEQSLRCGVLPKGWVLK